MRYQAKSCYKKFSYSNKNQTTINQQQKDRGNEKWMQHVPQDTTSNKKHQHLSQHPRTKKQVPPPSANTTGKKDGHFSHYPTINKRPGNTSPHLSEHPETSKKRKLGPASQPTAKIKPEPGKHKEQKPKTNPQARSTRQVYPSAPNTLSPPHTPNNQQKKLNTWAKRWNIEWPRGARKPNEDGSRRGTQRRRIETEMDRAERREEEKAKRRWITQRKGNAPRGTAPRGGGRRREERDGAAKKETVRGEKETAREGERDGALMEMTTPLGK